MVARTTGFGIIGSRSKRKAGWTLDLPDILASPSRVSKRRKCPEMVAIHTGTCILHSMMKQEIELSKYQAMSMEELGSYVSDYHKDVHGFRPRGDGLYGNRDALILIAEGLDAYMAARRSTFSGRESMRAEGWYVLETDPVQIQRSIWIAEERDRVNREANGGWWKEDHAEAPRLHRQYDAAAEMSAKGLAIR
jgi:hypothetical protein